MNVKYQILNEFAMIIIIVIVLMFLIFYNLSYFILKYLMK